MPSKRVLWGTRFGFYLAAVGSAFGLGNLWRFPYVAVENGGGLFVVLYIFLAVLVGLPMLISELMLGKLTRSSTMQAIGGLAKTGRPSRWIYAGRLSMITCLLILSYYTVISGWVLHFLAQFGFSQITQGGFNVERSLSILRENSGLQLLLASAHLLVVLVIVIKGVQQGIERWVGNIMPFFLVLLVVLAFRSINLPSADRAIRFLFYPDFANFKWGTLLSALGHVLFTLSVGVGTMITFGSYLKDDTHIPTAGFRVVTLDTLISLFAGLMIFPLLMETSFSQGSPEILFRALPRLLFDLQSGPVFGIFFFASLYFASLGATIGMVESMVSNLMGILPMSRSLASWVVGILTLVCSIIPVLSYSKSDANIFLDKSSFFLLDHVFVNIMLPLAALGVCLALSRQVHVEKLKAEFVNDDSAETEKLFSHWLVLIRYVIPGIFLMAFVLAFIGLFKAP